MTAKWCVCDVGCNLHILLLTLLGKKKKRKKKVLPHVLIVLPQDELLKGRDGTFSILPGSMVTQFREGLEKFRKCAILNYFSGH